MPRRWFGSFFKWPTHVFGAPFDQGPQVPISYEEMVTILIYSSAKPQHALKIGYNDSKEMKSWPEMRRSLLESFDDNTSFGKI